ncbi:MAG: SirB2 family protein [Proteobacteria bacterium]|nr:SirB2 family protein [Pseudomonadota bacterium]
MTYYLAIKSLHVACVVLSGGGFFLRGILMLNDSPILEQRWLKIFPHVNDTVLLVAALTLAVMAGWYPFVDAWITAKVFGLIAYIILGSLALKAGRSKSVRLASWLAALAIFGYIVSVALLHDPRGVFVWF